MCDGCELRRGGMLPTHDGARVNLIVVLREEGERAAAEDKALDAEDGRCFAGRADSRYRS